MYINLYPVIWILFPLCVCLFFVFVISFIKSTQVFGQEPRVLLAKKKVINIKITMQSSNL